MPSWLRYEPYDLSLQGRVFSISLSGAINSGSTSYAQVKTAAKKVTVIHYDLVSLTENMKFTVLEAPTITDGTSEVTPINVNRNSAETAVTKFYSNPSGVSGGTTILIHGMPSGVNKVGGSSDHSQTWSILPNTSYAIKLENLGNSTNTFVFNMAFFEH
jgi:hypothetical protein